ncbi:unnamed protein product [Tenebrio molitor]|nr:unnamed protein product [Tenebrio molitor]
MKNFTINHRKMWVCDNDQLIKLITCCRVLKVVKNFITTKLIIIVNNNAI